MEDAITYAEKYILEVERLAIKKQEKKITLIKKMKKNLYHRKVLMKDGLINIDRYW
jgi:hypothetical protein